MKFVAERKSMTRSHLHGTSALLGVLLAIGAVCPGTLSAATQWTERHRIPSAEGNIALVSAWSPRKGLRFKFQSLPAGRSAILTITGREGSIAVTENDNGRAVERPFERTHFNADALPGKSLPAADVLLKFRDDCWAVYVEERLVALAVPPVKPPFVLMQPDETMPAPGKARVRFQKTAPIRFRDDFLSPPKGDNPLAPWEPVSGSWSLHAAFQGSWQGRVKKLKPGQVMTEFSPNFYNLGGKGSNAVIVAGYPFYDRYVMQASVQVWPGEMGLVFYLSDTDDYFAFTIRKKSLQDPRARLRLWRVSPDIDPATPASMKNGFMRWTEKMGHQLGRRVLAAVDTVIVSGQWVMPRVIAAEDRIRCYLDEIKVIDIPMDLPPGGQFGLYANSRKNVLFDDVSVMSHPDMELEGASAFRTHTLYEQGSFFNAKNTPCFAPRAKPGKLTPRPSATEQLLVLGSTNRAGQVFSARLEPQNDTFAAGIVLDFRGPEEPYRRFVVERQTGGEICRLELVDRQGVTTLCESSYPRAARPRSMELSVDPTVAGELRMYRDGRLVLVHHGPRAAATGGAAGVYIAAKSAVHIAGARYSATRKNVYCNTFSEKQRFTEDPYMRHWSSPEGEWYEDENRLVWHKSDFFGAFSLFMPAVQNSEIHLGVEEGRTDGSLVVSVNGDRLTVKSSGQPGKQDEAADTAKVLGSALLPKRGDADQAWGYVVHCEDYWIWVSPARLVEEMPVTGTPLVKCRLREPPAGRRIRIGGFRTASLTRSRVTRYRVKDYLFTQAPHEWIINGGHWQVVNRFQCDPRWTHMNGESEDNLAALWSKYLFHGDFCIELYAGIRHGWYDRCGDLNTTAMADTTSPSRGYTVTCTGWDFDHSQELTKFYRNGKLLDKSDAYLVPRYRDGNKRINVDPLIKKGRDVHGAWYYIKFRRIGNRLEYHFDNQLVFATTDDSAIPAGHVGLWTFMNSMVIARMKISAEEIEPFAFAHSRVVTPPPAAKPRPRRQRWSVDDPIGCATLTWHDGPPDKPCFVLRNTIGSGRMFALCDEPPVPLSKIAGWTFLVKRTPGARFNFHYSVGRTDAEGTFEPLKRFFHRLSGTDFSRGPSELAGATPVPPAAGCGEDWHRAGEWTRVTVNIPVERFRKHLSNPNLLVKLEGFGNLQPSYVLQGLHGNAPGDAYAVGGLAAIPYDPPPLRVSCEWSKAYPDAVVLRSESPYTDRRLATAKVTIGKSRATLTAEGKDRHVAFLPRSPELVTPRDGSMPVQVDAGDGVFDFSLQRKAHPFRSVPVLLGLDELPALFENFEAVNGSSWVSLNGRSALVRRADRTQGDYLEVRNTEDSTRLRTTLSLTRPLAQLPVLQFRYRARPLAKVSLTLPDESVVRISEKYGAPVRHSAPLLHDWQWRTWHGIVTDAMKESAIDLRRLAVREAVIGSAHKWDQTGRYSRWHIDDVVFGPAIARAEQMKFTPRYFAFDGILSVSMAVLAGPKSFHELGMAEARGIEWVQVANGEPATPSLGGLRDGVHHLLLKATSGSGSESSVTDIPFLLDTKPMEVFRFIVKSRNLIANHSVLNVLFLTEGGAPPVLDDLEIRWNDDPIRMDFGPLYGTMSSHGHDIRLSLNWPYVFRKRLDRMNDGDRANIVVAKIRDGAGNVTRDVSVPVRIDYKSDKNPPNIVPPRYKRNVLLASVLQGRNKPPREIAVKGHNAGEIVRDKNGEPYLTCPIHPRVPVARGMEPPRHIPSVIYTIRGRKWDLAAHPYLSFRMRIPSIPKNAKASISLLAQTRVGPRVIPLLGKPKGPGIVPLPNRIEWRDNAWENITIDLASLLEKTAYDREFRKMRVTKLAFVCDGFATEKTFHLQNLYIYAALPNPPSPLLDAYDASGIKGFSWTGPDALEEEVHARALDLEGWAEIRAHDKAGNVSPPLRAPLSILPKSSVESRLLFDDEDE